MGGVDLKTQKRIQKYQQQQKEKKKMNSTNLTSAQKARLQKLKDAKKRKPGFGSGSASVADHLNEVVGLTEHKLTRKEIRDKRIEEAARSGAGCRRFEVAGGREFGISNKNQSGRQLGAGGRLSASTTFKPTGKTEARGHSNISNRAKGRQPDREFLAKTREDFFKRLLSQNNQTNSSE